MQRESRLRISPQHIVRKTWESQVAFPLGGCSLTAKGYVADPCTRGGLKRWGTANSESNNDNRGINHSSSASLSHGFGWSCLSLHAKGERLISCLLAGRLGTGKHAPDPLRLSATPQSQSVSGLSFAAAKSQLQPRVNVPLLLRESSYLFASLCSGYLSRSLSLSLSLSLGHRGRSMPPGYIAHPMFYRA